MSQITQIYLKKITRCYVPLKETSGAEMAPQWSHFHVHRLAPIQEKVPLRSHFGSTFFSARVEIDPRTRY